MLGKKFGESMKKLINITQNDIKEGVQSSPTMCPIARAVRRALKPNDIYVDSMNVIIGRKVFLLPHAVTNFIQGYDIGLRVQPFKFTLDSERTAKQNAGLK